MQRIYRGYPQALHMAEIERQLYQGGGVFPGMTPEDGNFQMSYGQEEVTGQNFADGQGFAFEQGLAEGQSTWGEQNNSGRQPDAWQQPGAQQMSDMWQQPGVQQMPDMWQQPGTWQMSDMWQQPGAQQMTSAWQQPETCQQPAARQQPGAVQQPSARQQPGAVQQPAARQQPGAVQQPSARQQSGADRNAQAGGRGGMEPYMIYRRENQREEPDRSRALRMEIDYFKSLCPLAMRKRQVMVDEVCDQMDYANSPMYDEYPDRVSIYQMRDGVCRHAREAGMDADEDLTLLLLLDEINRRRRLKQNQK